jgi:succinate-semialdehyde dehydrogenase/glutarate-semialdehyde dehydrogenase
MDTAIESLTRKIVSENPATGDILHEFECANDANVRAAVERGRAAQRGWSALGVERRVAILRRFQRALLDRKREVARAITEEAGKPYVEALLTEVLVVLDSARFVIEHAFGFLRDEVIAHGNPAMKAKRGRILREPHGVIGIISPWNYPFSTPATETLAALATGNAVVLKPSELTPLMALELAKLLHAAGVPDDVFQVVIGDGATGAALLDSSIDKVVFTGSVATGRRVAQACAGRLIPVVLELGGKDPMIVLEDADIDVASSAAVWGAFMNAGQTCLSVERCYVHHSLYADFLDACVEKTRKLTVGNGMGPETEVGPMIHERQLKIVEAHVHDARARGARVLAGGSRLLEKGPNFYAPTVIADVTHEMLIMREETFGPVLPVAFFENDEEAVRVANDSEFGLAASVWTGDRARGEALARQIVAGTVMVNDVLSCFGISEAPHGGMKSSGIGRTHGRFGMEEMVRVKYLDSDLMPGMKKLWWYGYGESFARQMEGFVDLLFANGVGKRMSGAVRSAGAVKKEKKL